LTLPVLPPEELREVFGGEAPAAEVEPLGHGPPAATVGVWRVRVEGASAVLKVVEHNADGHPRWPSAAAPEHPYYWRREPLTYESALLDRLGELRAPRLLASVARDDGAVALWLEDAPPPPPFTPDLLGEVARRLGEAQGVFAVEPPVERWLSRRWLRAYLALRAPITREQERVLARVEAAPRTLCHLDFYPGNLLGKDAEVIIDWAYCGLGALGEDPGNLVPDTMFDGFVEPSLAGELEQAVWEGYLTGLRDSPWRGDEREVQWVFLASPVIKYTWIPAAIADPGTDEMLRSRWSKVIPLLDRWAEKAEVSWRSPRRA
jgi:hypothetical protein